MLQRSPGIKIDLYDSMPTPYGLVRYGVAPDHPEVKNCIQTFESVALHKDFTYVGHVALGTEQGRLPLSVLRPHYDALFFAYGASRDRTLEISGENLDRIVSARAFVGWYNGLPEYSKLQPRLDEAEDVVIIGQGNVALDVARTLLSPIDRLRQTDITEDALQALTKSRVKRVNIIGRRGPLQAPYTTKEVREMMNLPGVSFDPIAQQDHFLASSDKLPRQLKRLAQVLNKGSAAGDADSRRHWSMQYMLSPSRFEGSVTNKDRVGSVVFDKTQYVQDATTVRLDDLNAIRGMRVKSVEPTCQEFIKADLVFRSIGYKSEAISGLDELGITFDAELGIMPNDLHGRVLATGRGPGNLTVGHVPGMYCAGWVKRGPTGVIATTMDDAFISADVLIKDWSEGVVFDEKHASGRATTERPGWDAVKHEAASRGIRSVSWEEWLVIDREEKRRGRARGKEREKCKSVADMLAILDG